MEIIKDITKVNRSIVKDKKNEYIVIHYVGSVSSAKNNGAYFRDVNRNASAHYFVDSENIVQVVEDLDASWHCGALQYKHRQCRNINSIGIEICCYKDFSDGGICKMLPLAIKKAKELTKELAMKYNIPKENILRHYDVTGKSCPMEWSVENCKEWEEFKEGIYE